MQLFLADMSQLLHHQHLGVSTSTQASLSQLHPVASHGLPGTPLLCAPDLSSSLNSQEEESIPPHAYAFHASKASQYHMDDTASSTASLGWTLVPLSHIYGSICMLLFFFRSRKFLRPFLLQVGGLAVWDIVLRSPFPLFWCRVESLALMMLNSLVIPCPLSAHSLAMILNFLVFISLQIARVFLSYPRVLFIDLHKSAQ